jgi:hypothetical protein
MAKAKAAAAASPMAVMTLVISIYPNVRSSFCNRGSVSLPVIPNRSGHDRQFGSPPVMINANRQKSPRQSEKPIMPPRPGNAASAAFSQG